jgi:predicted RNA methylase
MEEIQAAAEKAQEIIDKTEASNPLVHKMMGIVRKFIQHNRVLCYGGTAINNLLPKEKQFYNPETDIPDYDFFTETPQKHAKQIADLLVKAGIPNVEVKPGVHLGTFKVFADYTGVADVSSMEHAVFKKLWAESIEKDGLHYVPPNFLRMSVYLELSRPRGFVERWTKVYKRLKLLNDEYPIECPGVDPVHEEAMTPELVKKVEAFLSKENVILMGFNAETRHGSGRTWKLPLDILVTPEHFDMTVDKVKDIFGQARREDFAEYAEILPAHSDITHKNTLLARVFETDACHSYHPLENGMRIASIPTLLNFFFAMLYADNEFIEHTSKARLICAAQELVDMADNAGKRRFKLLTPTECTGKQKGLPDMKEERTKLYSQLSTNKNSKAFLKYFFTYTPKQSFRGGKHDKVMFPEKAGVDYDQLKLTPEGEYSITKRHDSKKIIQYMRSLVGSLKGKTIADLTGNVGGDTIMFGLNYKHVDSYEWNPENFDVLKHNVGVYDLKNVTLHQGDSTELFKKNVDVLYMDPPWGGPDYKEKKELDLLMGKKTVSEYLKDVTEAEWKPGYIFIKVPANFAFDSLKILPVKKILKFKIRGFYLLGMHVL